MSKQNKTEILNVLIDNLSLDETVEKIEKLIDNQGFNYITTPNPEMIVEAQGDEEFKNILNRADLAIADGFGLSLASLLTKNSRLEQICGSDIVWDIFRIASQKSKKIYLLGGLGNTAELTKKIVQQKIPNISIVGAESGGRLIREKGEWLLEEGLIERIKSSQADILIIARGFPWQEKFINDFKNRLSNLTLAIGVGGTFDFISGRIKRAPVIFRRLRLEWLWRLFQEPWRIKRIYKAVFIFLYLFIKNKIMFGRKKIRVRFAPSPTGFLHIGGLRTALYSWLFAKKNKGDFILRIEDTDQSRTVKDGEKNIIENLAWAGINPDEGMYINEIGNVEQKGKYGPYRQSERLDIYHDYLKQLIDSDKAYYCFCTSERLQDMREKQIKEGKAPRYDGLCRKLTPDEIKNKIDSKIPHVIRLKVPQKGKTEFNDKIFGKISVDNKDIDDQVLLKSDGFPTYHLANVIDDHLMKISHVTRGEEWLPSTPKHILLYRAFGWEPPIFAHFPLLLNADKSKLSKRQGDVAVADYKEKGYLPEALVNFVALLGWNPKGDQEIYNIPELISYFELEDVNKSGAIFNTDKLNWLNNHYIKIMEPEKLTKLAIPYLINANQITAKEASQRLNWLVKIVITLRERINKLSELPSYTGIYLKKVLRYNKDLLIWKNASESEIKSNLEGILQQIEAFDDDEFVSQNIEQRLKIWINNQGLKNGPVLWPMRVALSGEEKSPPPFDIAEILGREESITRIKNAIKLLS